MSDSEYPPLYNVSSDSDDEIKSNIEIDQSSLEALLETANADLKDSVLVDSEDVKKILDKEGFDPLIDDVKAINVFPSPMDAFQYALYTFGQEDMYIVLMVNIRLKTIYGYHVLDLTQDYSLADDLINRLKNKDFLL